ncbi:hypothetical protein PENSPDRAFT_60924 [Peniophora sp. CONT]|nr:hypothetical protein PENSPDRAFT_60924 [Peniophora sp. CONT]
MQSTRPASAMPSLVPLDSTLGASSIGVIASNIFYGINCMQVFLYYTDHCKHDGWFLRTFIGVVLAMETLVCVLLNYGIYFYTVTNFGDYEVLLDSVTVWSILVEIGLSTFIALQAQCFFAYRVYILGGKKLVLPIIITILSLAQFALGLVYIDASLSFKRLAGGSSDFPYVISLYGLELIADTTIAVSSIYYLYARASRTEIRSTKQVIYVIIKYVINTCLLEVVCIIPIIALWTADASSLTYAPFVFILARVYSASVLCSLNNRDYLREVAGYKNGSVIMSGIRAQPCNSATPRTESSDNSTQNDSFYISRNPIRLETGCKDTGPEHGSDAKNVLV